MILDYIVHKQSDRIKAVEVLADDIPMEKDSIMTDARLRKDMAYSCLNKIRDQVNAQPPVKVVY
jgi:hypothetical protein